MTYRDVVKVLSEKEQVSEKEIEREMRKAIQYAGFTCSPQIFIEKVTTLVVEKDYIS